jgi:hypothetical protein
MAMLIAIVVIIVAPHPRLQCRYTRPSTHITGQASNSCSRHQFAARVGFGLWWTGVGGGWWSRTHVDSRQEEALH